MASTSSPSHTNVTCGRGSALTKLAWTELCAALDILEQESKGGNYARDLAPRLRKLRDQAKAKLQAFETDGSRAACDSANVGNHHQGHHPDHNDLEDLAVLGTATRKLDFNKPSQTARNFSMAARLLADTVSVGSGSSGAGSARSSPTGATPASPLQTVSRGTSANARSINLRHPQPQVNSSDRSVASMQTSGYRLARQSSPPLTARMEDEATVLKEQHDNLQTYVNLDSNLAKVLASVSGTQAQPTSAAFPVLARNDPLPSPSWIGPGHSAQSMQPAHLQMDPTFSAQPEHTQHQQHHTSQHHTPIRSFKVPKLPKLSRHPLATQTAAYPPYNEVATVRSRTYSEAPMSEVEYDPLPPSQRSIAAAAAYAAQQQAQTQAQLREYNGVQDTYHAHQGTHLHPVYLQQPHPQQIRPHDEARSQTTTATQHPFYQIPSAAEVPNANHQNLDSAPTPLDLRDAYPMYAAQPLKSDLLAQAYPPAPLQDLGLPNIIPSPHPYDINTTTAPSLLSNGLGTSAVPPHSGLRMYDDLFSTLGVHEGGFVPSAPSSTASGHIPASRHGPLHQQTALAGTNPSFGTSMEILAPSFSTHGPSSAMWSTRT